MLFRSPTGGAGLALPAWRASLITATTFLAISWALGTRTRAGCARNRLRNGEPENFPQGEQATVHPGGCATRAGDQLCLLIWENSSSTGVSRPKIESRALSLLRSPETSITSPWKSLNGPAVSRI